MISPYSLRHKFCLWCKYCINNQNQAGSFLCGKDGNRYMTDKFDEYGMPMIPCINGQFEVNEDKLIGVRW